jgi:hypothetical protein
MIVGLSTVCTISYSALLRVFFFLVVISLAGNPSYLYLVPHVIGILLISLIIHPNLPDKQISQLIPSTSI